MLFDMASNKCHFFRAVFGGLFFFFFYNRIRVMFKEIKIRTALAENFYDSGIKICPFTMQDEET